MVRNSPKHIRLVSKTSGLVFYSGCIKYVQIPVYVPSSSGFVTMGERGPEDSYVVFCWERWMSGSQGCHQTAGSGRGGVWALTAVLGGKAPAATCPLSSPQQEVWLHMESKVTFRWSSHGSLSEALLWCLSSDILAPRADGHFRDGSYLPLWTWGWR